MYFYGKHKNEVLSCRNGYKMICLSEARGNFAEMKQQGSRNVFSVNLSTNNVIAREYLKVLVPALFAALLILVMIFGIFLPAAQEQLLRQKKIMLSAVTETAWSILDSHERHVKAGNLSPAQARQDAIRDVRTLRYGPAGKDYLWIIDLQPAMVMHPYRPDLNGKELRSYADAQGRLLFQEMAQVARKNGSGYVEYLWQWKDEPSQVGPKLSYVRLFPEWGWVIGTGVYLDDVAMERRTIIKEFAALSIELLAAIFLVSSFILFRSLREVRRRMAAEKERDDYRDHLEDLVGQRTAELKAALASVKTLHGLLPICTSCKKIRDDKGYWNQLESYIRNNSNAEFSHGICPDCAERLYPDYFSKDSVT